MYSAFFRLSWIRNHGYDLISFTFSVYSLLILDAPLNMMREVEYASKAKNISIRGLSLDSDKRQNLLAESLMAEWLNLRNQIK